MKHTILALALAGALFPRLGLAGPYEDLDPLTKAAIIDEGSFDVFSTGIIGFETGALMRITDNTHLDYTIVPAVLSLRSPAHWVFDVGRSTLAFRARLNLLAQAFASGPESYYLGFSGSPSIEWWFPGERTYLSFAIGGGAGWLDSTNIDGGQGQDFTYNWYIHTGIHRLVNERTAISLGLMFQHQSNRGATDPNPGLDTLGPVIGISRHF